MHTLTVNASVSGVRLQDFLERQWPDVDRAFLRRIVAEGLVVVNRMECRGRQRLGPGDVVDVRFPGGVEELPTRRRPAGVRAEAEAIDVLAEHRLAVVVDKPARIPTVPDRAGKYPGVLGAVAARRLDDELRIAHRLDRDTSGCLALARGLDGARWLDRAFRDGAIDKRYLALVEGALSRERLDIRRSLGPDPRRPGKVRVVAEGDRRSRAAHSEVTVVERFRGYTLVWVRPTTGRSHQIRVHLQSIGHPIVADTDYGSRGPLKLSAFKRGYKTRPGVVERPLLERMFLHAESIGLPAHEELDALCAESPLPADLERALVKLRRFASVSRGEERCG